MTPIPCPLSDLRTKKKRLEGPKEEKTTSQARPDNVDSYPWHSNAPRIGNDRMCSVLEKETGSFPLCEW